MQDLGGSPDGSLQIRPASKKPSVESHAVGTEWHHIEVERLHFLVYMPHDLIIEAEGGELELYVVTLLVEVGHGPLELLVVVLGLFKV